jgi:hypothetical protein
MRHGKSGRMMLRLALPAVVGLMAVGAAVAQAALPGESTPGEFKVLNAAINLAVTFKGEEELPTTFLIPGRNIDIICSEGITEEGKFISKKEGLAKLLYGGCEVFEHNTLKKSPCHVAPSLDITLKAIFLPILHGKKLFVLLEPDGSTVFGVVTFKSGTGCVLPLSTKIEGSISAEVEEGEGVTRLLEFDEAIQKLTGDVFKFGAFEMYIKFSGLVIELTGNHAGCKWGIV